MRHSSLYRFLVSLLLAGWLAGPAHAAGRNGFAMSGSLGAAGGAQVSTASGTPSLAAGVEIGANIDGGSLFVGAFYDRFTSTIWQAGISARKFLGSSRFVWGQLKVSFSGMAGMIGDDAAVKEWNGYLNGGLAAGLRIPIMSALSLQPFAGFDSFLPIIGTKKVYVSPTEEEIKLVTGRRAFIPMAGLRLALEF